MMQRFRLPDGGRIDRSQPLRFSFDGREYEGFAGDTLASALLANGVHLMARSFKYHRPRGPVSAGAEEPNALVEVDRGGGRCTPNLRATQVELYDGLVARSQNRWPSLAFDANAVNDVAAPLFPAGFYYKTFMWPRRAWVKLYEPMIRRAAGLGRAPDVPDPDHYAQRYAHCEVLVIGAGPAGIAAACAAAASGARVILCDEQQELGGSLLAERYATIDDMAAQDWLAARVRMLGGSPNVRLLPRTTAFGYYAQNFVGLAERVTDHLAEPDARLPRERLWQVRAKQVVIATGAIERPLVFPDNDRPGIMLADAARNYAVQWGVQPGRRAVIATACDSAYRAALDLHEAGVKIALIADLRSGAPSRLAEAVHSAGIRVATGMTVLGTAGRLRVRAVDVAPVANMAARERIACDLLCMSGGWTPSIHLFSQSRGKPQFDAERGAFIPGVSAQDERSAGACRGLSGLADVLADGAAAGAAASRAAGFDIEAAPIAVADAEADTGWALGVLPQPETAPRKRAFVDFQNDVTAKDLKLATQEGFRSIEHVKRYTTTGMATDQGKTSNMNALAIVADALGTAIPDVGLTTFRTPYTPVTFGTLAGYSRGALFDPVRTTPLHDWATSHGAVFEDVGAWKRARFYPHAGEDMHQAVARECRTVRSAVGMFDGSTLGKIDVSGPDAAEFLDRLYVNSFANLKPGRCRYGVMLGENGYVLDDGVIGRLAPDRFHVTTTTGGAAHVLAIMEDYRQTEWPELQVWLTSITEQWAVIAVQGPAARDVLLPLVQGIDIGRMPHMSIAEGTILDVPLRLFRVSFTGELGFELNVPAGHAEMVADQVWQRVQASGGALYGTEAMHVLRAEKGYVIVGQETDGTVTPDDAGLGWLIGRGKRDFVGKRSLRRPDLVASGRKQLVGLLPEGGRALDEGVQITIDPLIAPGTSALGHVTSAYASTAIGYPIALALVTDGRARTGERLHAQMSDGPTPVRVVAPVFYDPEGTRLNA